MKALRFHDRRDIRLEDLPTPEPGPGEVAVRVTEAGLSQTQIGEFMEGPFIITQDTHPLTGFSGPIIPCQEYGGVVEAIGPGVSPDLLGRQVAVLPAITCGECLNCLAGKDNVCEKLAYRGVLGADGGFCEISISDADKVVPVDEQSTLSFVEPILLGIHSAKRLDSRHAGRALVIGAGAVGCALGAVWQDCAGIEVTMYDVLRPRLDRAGAMGLAITHELPEAGEFDLVVDAAGKDLVHDDALTTAVEICRPGGTVVGIGSYFSPVEFVPASWSLAEKTLQSSFAYASGDVADLSTWMDKLDVDFGHLTTHVPLDRLVEDGYYQAELDKGSFTRIVTSV